MGPARGQNAPVQEHQKPLPNRIRDEASASDRARPKSNAPQRRKATEYPFTVGDSVEVVLRGDKHDGRKGVIDDIDADGTVWVHFGTIPLPSYGFARQQLKLVDAERKP